MNAAAWASTLIGELFDRVGEEIDRLTLEGEGLRAPVDARYGHVVVEIDHDAENEALRVSISVPVPPGGGKAFLLWCLAMNVSYWDVKVGVGEDGRLVVLSDLDAPQGADLDELATDVLDRADSVVDFLDDDLVGWLMAHGLGTPTQRERWRSRPTTGSIAGDEKHTER